MSILENGAEENMENAGGLGCFHFFQTMLLLKY